MGFVIAELAEPLNMSEWIVALACLAIGAGVAAVAMSGSRAAFAPQRLPADAPSSNLWLAIFAGLFGELILPGVLIVPLLAPLGKPPTAHQTAILFLSSSACGLLVLLSVHRLLRPHWRMSRPISGAVIPALVGAIAIIPLVIATNLLVQQVWAMLHLQAPASHRLLTAFNDQSSSQVDRWCVVLSAVVAAPLFEEMLFRAYLQTAIRQFTRQPWMAIVTAATLFSLAHASAWMFIPLFTLALGLGYLYERTNNLYATIAIHGAFNALMIGLDMLLLSRH